MGDFLWQQGVQRLMKNILTGHVAVEDTARRNDSGIALLPELGLSSDEAAHDAGCHCRFLDKVRCIKHSDVARTAGRVDDVGQRLMLATDDDGRCGDLCQTIGEVNPARSSIEYANESFLTPGQRTGQQCIEHILGHLAIPAQLQDLGAALSFTLTVCARRNKARAASLTGGTVAGAGPISASDLTSAMSSAASHCAITPPVEWPTMVKSFNPLPRVVARASCATYSSAGIHERPQALKSGAMIRYSSAGNHLSMYCQYSASEFVTRT